MVFSFNEKEAPVFAKIGGKAKALVETIKADFPVPDGFVLTTEFFHSWIEQIKKSTAWQAFIVEQTKGNCDKLKILASQLSFSAKQNEVLTNALKDLAEVTMFAVRSSSPEEDLEDVSFAGIYESVLGVKYDHLEDAVKSCFASIFDERVVRYKSSKGFDAIDHKIAVIVQKQLASETSGVAFTLNPVTNSYDEVVINANFGLGNTVVDGNISADQFIVDKVSKTILERTAGKKEYANYLKSDGGNEIIKNTNPEDLCLSDEQVLAISDLAVKVEIFHQQPIDIEWAYEKKQFFLLQARPVTGFLKFPPEVLTIPGESKKLYADVLLTQHGLTESLSPLGEGIIKLFYTKAMKALGMDESVSLKLVTITAGRWYSDLGLGIKLSGKKAVLKGIDNIDALGSRILDQMDVKQYLPKKLPKGLMKSGIKAALSSFKIISNSRKAYKNPDQYLEYFLAENDKLTKALHNEFTDNLSFTDFSHKALDMISTWLTKISSPTAYATIMARSKIEKMFKYDAQSVKDKLPLLERAFPHNVTIEMGDLLYELAQFPEIKEIENFDDFIKKLDEKQISHEFREKWELFIHKYSFRCPYELDVATPRYYEKPKDIFTLLKTMNSGDDPEITPQALFAKGAKIREETYQLFLKKLKSKKMIKLYNKRYKVLETFVAYREIHKYYMIMAVDLIRRKALKVAGDFLKAQRLDKEEDIFKLRIEEVSAALLDSKMDLRPLIKANQSFLNQFKTNRNLPSIFDSRGFIPTFKQEVTKENELSGTPVSPGVVKGPVKILSRPDEKPVLHGDILVAEATDPGWTTLFLNAAGVLIQNGGMLQHGASVARESCKPCVVGLVDITQILKDGQLVEMDGSTGLVKLLS